MLKRIFKKKISIVWVMLITLILIVTLFSKFSNINEIKGYEKDKLSAQEILARSIPNSEYMKILVQEVENNPSRQSCTNLVVYKQNMQKEIEALIALNQSKISKQTIELYKSTDKEYRFDNFVIKLGEKKLNKITKDDLVILKRFIDTWTDLQDSLAKNMGFYDNRNATNFAITYIIYSEVCDDIFNKPY